MKKMKSPPVMVMEVSKSHTYYKGIKTIDWFQAIRVLDTPGNASDIDALRKYYLENKAQIDKKLDNELYPRPDETQEEFFARHESGNKSE